MRKIFIFCSLSLLVLFSLRNHAFGLQSDTGKVYKIQIASFENKISVDEIKRNYYLTETVSVELIGNRYKYFIGDFPVKYDALSYLSTLGIPGAYVVTWEINPNLQAENVKLIARLETSYMLQIAATIKKLQLSIFKSSPYFLDTEVNVYFDGKLFIYTIGEFSDSAKAENYKQNFSFPSYVVKQTETIIYNSGEGLVKERTEEIIDQEGIDTLREENNIPGKIIDSNDIDSSGIISGEEIIEIEGQAQQNGLIVWFKNLPFYLYALIVFSIILLIVFVIILIIRKNFLRKTAGQNHFHSNREEEISSPFLEKKNEERTMAGVSEIMQLYTNLSTE
ncbi:SPOR domain-containing protein, partial [Bacteroidota bacterium]